MGDEESRREVDQRLINRFIHDKDRWAFSQIYKVYAPKIMKLVRRRCWNRELHDECFQETWRKFIKHLDEKESFEIHHDGLWPFLRKTCINAISSLGMAEERQRGPRETREMNEIAEAKGLDDHAKEEIYQCLRRFEVRKRDAFILCKLNGATRAEAAEILHVSVSAIDQWLGEIVQALREEEDFELP